VRGIRRRSEKCRRDNRCYLAKFRPAHMYIPLYISARLHVRVCVCVSVSVWWNAGQRPGMTYAVCYWNFARMWKASRWKLRNASREWLLLIIYLNAAVRVCEWVMWFSVNRRRKWFFCSYLTSKSVARQPRIFINVCVWTPFLICTYSHIHMCL